MIDAICGCSRSNSTRAISFVTEERGVVKRMQFQEQVKAEDSAAEAARNYKAQPLIFPSPMKIHHDQAHKTEPKPFVLQTEEFSQKMKLEFEKVISSLFLI